MSILFCRTALVMGLHKGTCNILMHSGHPRAYTYTITTQRVPSRATPNQSNAMADARISDQTRSQSG